MTKYNYMIGTTMGNLVNVESLVTALANQNACVPPKGLFVEPYSVYRTAANGLEVGDGFPRFDWTFDAMHNDQLKAMLVYVPNQSAEIYARTRKTDRTYGYYKCIIHRPKPDEMEPAFNDMWHNITFHFTMAELQEDP